MSDLARAIRREADRRSDAARSAHPGVVVSVDPLQIQLASGILLDDDEFEVGQYVESYRRVAGLAIDDVAWMLRGEDSWLLVEIQSDTAAPDIGVAAGPVGGDKTYIHTQVSASTTWTIPHGLGKKPAWEAYDTLGRQIEGAASFPDANTLMIEYSAAVAGEAYCN